MSSAACVKRACTFPSYTFIASIPMALLNTGTVRNVVCQYINIYIIIYVCVYTDIPLKESTIYFYIAKQNHVSEPTSLHADKNLAGFSTSWRAASTHKVCEKKHAARTRPAHGVARQVEDLRRPPISWLTASACAAVAMQGTLMTADSAAGASQKRKLFGNLITNWRR